MRESRSLLAKLMPVFFLAFLIPICLFALLSMKRLRENITESLEQQTQTSLEKADQCLDMALDKYDSILYDLCTDDDVLSALEYINTHGVDDKNARISRLRRTLSHICNRNYGIEGIVIQLPSGDKIYYDRRSSSSANSTWIDERPVPSVRKGAVYEAPKAAVDVGDEKIHIFQIARKLVDYRDIRLNIGTAVLNVNENILKKAVDGGEKNQVYLCDGSTVISAPDGQAIGLNKSKISTEHYKVAEMTNMRSGWVIRNYLSVRQYQKTMTEQRVFWILVAAGTVAVMLLLVYCFTKPLVKSVNLVVDAMNEAEKGDFQARVALKPSMPREIQRIGSGFNEMVEKIDQLLKQVKSAVLEQKNAEISALEAQIDPHFLYNTLDTINWKAIENEQYEISEMVGALADILRYAVKNAGGETTLERELFWLHQYMLLQSAKLGRELKTEVHVPKGLEMCRIHKLLLQPFVENSIKHGFYQQERECILEIEVEEAQNQLHLVVVDNGRGMSQEEVDKLNDEQCDMGTHLGISNVRKRLRLYYGEEGSIYFESVLNCGTKVHLFIPRSEEEQHEDCDSGGRSAHPGGDGEDPPEDKQEL